MDTGRLMDVVTDLESQLQQTKNVVGVRDRTINELRSKVDQLENYANAFGIQRSLRSRGWVVAVHNDYHLNGCQYTFWLFTKEHFFAKGEGSTDSDALQEVMVNINKLERK